MDSLYFHYYSQSYGTEIFQFDKISATIQLVEISINISKESIHSMTVCLLPLRWLLMGFMSKYTAHYYSP